MPFDKFCSVLKSRFNVFYLLFSDTKREGCSDYSYRQHFKPSKVTMDQAAIQIHVKWTDNLVFSFFLTFLHAVLPNDASHRPSWRSHVGLRICYPLPEVDGRPGLPRQRHPHIDLDILWHQWRQVCCINIPFRKKDQRKKNSIKFSKKYKFNQICASKIQ